MFVLHIVLFFNYGLLFLLYLRVQRLFGAKFQLEFTCYKIGKSITES